MNSCLRETSNPNPLAPLCGETWLSLLLQPGSKPSPAPARVSSRAGVTGTYRRRSRDPGVRVLWADVRSARAYGALTEYQFLLFFPRSCCNI